jgi:hypothetical protein
MSLHDRIWNPDSSSNGGTFANEFAVWAPGDPISQKGERLLIGVARWSQYDHQLLSLLESLPPAACRIDLFDADLCKTQEAVGDYIPGIGFVHHTPFVGYWRDGKLVQSENGYAGRHLIYRVLGLDPEEADRIVLQRPAPTAV